MKYVRILLFLAGLSFILSGCSGESGDLQGSAAPEGTGPWESVTQESTESLESTARESIAQESREPRESTVRESVTQEGAESLESTARESIAQESAEKDFYISEIDDEMFSGMQGRSYREGCPVPREDLVCVHALHVDAGGVTHKGEMICNRCIADRVVGILEELYENSYPIERMEPVDSYGGDDERSMEANNSSCFNFRMVSNTNVISKHGMGLAVDINPLYNPCVRKVNGVLSVEPETGKPYADRTGDFEYKIVKDDLCYRLFRENGFVWGGEWKSLKDYQHFEVPDEVSDELMKEYLQAK